MVLSGTDVAAGVSTEGATAAASISPVAVLARGTSLFPR
jgi:hypothetical protein